MSKGHNLQWWKDHPEKRKSCSEKHKKLVGPLSPLYGKHKSKEHKANLSEATKKAFKKKKEKGEHIGRYKTAIRKKSKCKWCSKKYEHNSDEKGKYCSNDCRLADIIYNGNNYRLKAISFKDHSCQFCGKFLPKRKIIIHHIDNDRTNNDLENLAVTCIKCHSKFHKKQAEEGRKYYGNIRIQRGIKEVLLGMKLDVNDPNFKATPQRVSRMYYEMFEGLYKKDELEELLTTSIFPSTYSGIIIHENITAFSMCPHHLLPVEYNVTIGYISKHTIGLSKLPRFVELIAKRPVLQETLTNDIADTLMKHLEAEGAMVVVKGKHSCMRVRGVRTVNNTVTTSSVRGSFADNPNLREEFALLLKFQN